MLAGWNRWIVLIAIGLTGCKGGRATSRNPTEERLYKIGKAYNDTCFRLQRPPENLEDIKPDIPGGFSDEVLISPNDGEKFVILWGVDFPTLPPASRQEPFTVAGYESKGVNGTRYVLRFPLSIAKLNDEDFHKAVFPPGHRPP
jgi:hypothetical protein